MVLKLRKKWANVIEKCVYLCVCLPSEEDTIAIKLIESLLSFPKLKTENGLLG